MSSPADSNRSWLFLTNHAQALLTLARMPDARARDVAEDVGVTERSAQRLISDLVESGCVERTRVGRRNRYRVNRGAELRHPQLEGKDVGSLLDAFLR